ncbi:MAG: hypothetical protein H8E55_09770 [Pelagibacterales bacterium]|jgi:hypothetical protein|nr:hypothetical protein [Pelagibacterales bacterium]|tara:strand:- start:83 stop:376 length:294 start_codon:yes stop_codon:yes gene_type:complete
MIKKLTMILVLNLFLTNPVFAWCGDEFGGLFDWSKEHKACGKYSRDLEKRLNLDQWDATDAYCSCRIRLDNLKKYGMEKIHGPEEYRDYPGLRSVRP